MCDKTNPFNEAGKEIKRLLQLTEQLMSAYETLEENTRLRLDKADAERLVMQRNIEALQKKSRNPKSAADLGAISGGD